MGKMLADDKTRICSSMLLPPVKHNLLWCALPSCAVVQAKDPCSQALLSAMDPEDPAVADIRGRIADM